MAEEKHNMNRISLLADVAEMYYSQGKDQSAIAKQIGVTRSMVSRMLTEARNRGIVDIRIIRPIQYEQDLEDAIRSIYGIETVYVVSIRNSNHDKLLIELGKAAAQVLDHYLPSDAILGLAWGTTISAVVDAVESTGKYPGKVVQLVGAMGAQNAEYDGHALVQRLANKLGGNPYFINAPYLCQSSKIAQSMMETRGIKETIELGKKIQIALLGIGTTEIEYSSYFLAGLLPEEEIKKLVNLGVVGDVASNFYKLNGKPYCDDFMRRLITIQLNDLVKIPIRIGVAGGPGKVNAIIGALHSKLVNVLVTDSITARSILASNPIEK